MIIFPEIHSLEDYEQMANPKVDDTPICDYEGTIILNNQVVFRDYYDEKFTGKICYNGHGICIICDDENIVHTPKNKFYYYKVSNLDFKKLSIEVDYLSFKFANLQDLENFVEFIDSYNARMDIFLDKAINKIKQIYITQKVNSLITTVFKEFIEIIPDITFYDEERYLLLLYFFSNRYDIVRKYIKFTENDGIESRKILEISRNCGYLDINRKDSLQHLSIKNLVELILLFENFIKLDINFQEEYVPLYLYFLLKEMVVNRYSTKWEEILIWKNKQDYAYKPTDGSTYIEYCVKEGLVYKNDGRRIFWLACYVNKYIDKSQDDLRFTVRKIRENPLLTDDDKLTQNLKFIAKYSDPVKTKHNGKKLVNVSTNAYEKLNNLIGLSAIKNDVNDMINLVRMQIKRKEQGLKAVPVSLHLVFTGNPGTGKTTIARILAETYKEIGVLSKGQLVEVDRSGLVAGYVGQTAIKTQKKINEALGGILFIDEAYTLVKEGQDYGQEAIDTLLKAMEDHRDDFIVIVAGYSDLIQNFINSNPGLKSRFNKYIDFPDYSGEELVEIFYSMCNDYQYSLTSDADKILKEKIYDMDRNKGENFANARDVRNLFETVITRQATRLSVENNADIMKITEKDFE